MPGKECCGSIPVGRGVRRLAVPIRAQHRSISGRDGAGLPPNYSLFGTVVKGLDVVEAMHTVRTGAQDRPVEAITIESVAITESI